MKRISLMAIMLLAAAVFWGAEVSVIENPGTPKNNNAGKVVTPIEIMRITDESGDFFFKRPGNIKIAPDNSIFVVDEDHFLRFDSKGTFLNNQFKKGQGPGEYNYILYYQFVKDGIVIFTNQPYKIVETDMNGNLRKETRLHEKLAFKRILGLVNDKFWLLTSSFESIRDKNTGTITVNLELAWGTRGSTIIEKTGLTFPEKWYLLKTTTKEGGRIMTVRRLWKSVFISDQNKILYVSNEPQYMINQVDLGEGKIVRRFNRKYESIPFKDERTEEEKKQNQIGTDPEYFSDIQNILIRGDRLWVVTSTLSQEKGVLVDVFTKDGAYVDNFYLKLPGVTRVKDLERKPMTLHEKVLFTVEDDEEGNKVVVKYKVDY
jgi:hypothetical protein